MLLHPYDYLWFGKYKTYSLEEVYHYNPGYIEFLIKYNQEFEIDIEEFKCLGNSFELRPDERESDLSIDQMIGMDRECFTEYQHVFSPHSISILELKQQGIYEAPEYVSKKRLNNDD